MGMMSKWCLFFSLLSIDKKQPLHEITHNYAPVFSSFLCARDISCRFVYCFINTQLIGSLVSLSFRHSITPKEVLTQTRALAF